MDAHELARWTRFAAKGGIGKCTAVVDCIAQEMGEDLMFLKGDEITVLMQLPEVGVYLGHCEGVVGRFSGKDVRFHGKLKKPVMAKRASVSVPTGGPESRTSISIVEGSSSRVDLPGQGSRLTSESPHSRPESRTKRTLSSSQSKSHVHMQSYSTSYSRYSDDRSPTTTVVDTWHTSTIDDTRTRHAKPPQMVTSVSGASIFSVGSTSIYSQASTATSVDSAANATLARAGSRNGSIHSIMSDETERDIPADPEYGNADQANGTSDPHELAFPSVSTPKTMLSTSASTSTSILASTSTSGTSFASTSTYDADSVHGSFGSVGSISELEAKQFDTNGFCTERQTGFILVPPPLEIGGNTASLIVAPLRVSKSPRLAPSPGLPPSSPASPAALGEHPRSTPVSPVFSPGIPGFLSPKLPTSPSFTFPGPLSPGLPGSLSPGQRSPGFPGSLSPGFRSPAFSHGPDAQFQYMFSSSGSGSSSPNLSLTSPYDAIPSPSLTDPKSSPNDNNVLNAPDTRTQPAPLLPFGLAQPYSGPLSPPPSLPLPPLPEVSLPLPAFPVTAPPTATGTAVTAAASGRTSPLAVLSSSLPPATPGSLYVNDRHNPRDGNETGHGRGHEDGAWDEVEEGNTTRLSTLDAFRRRLDDSAEKDEIGYMDHSEDEGERMLHVSETEGEEVHSDGEVGIGLSLMGALGGEDEEDEEDEDLEEQAREIRDENDNAPGASNMELSINGSAPSISAQHSGITAMAWTRYTPSLPVSSQSPNGYRQTREEEDGDEEEEDDGAYWDDIYDDYRYSRCSLASKRFSAASKRVSVMSKASGVSKASSKARAIAPPMPIPPDRPSFDAPRTSIGSDRMGGHPRPSLESASSSMSASASFPRPSLTRTVSDESTHRTHVLPLTAQFPAVPVHVPVRTESRLRIVHDGYMQGDNDHGEKELQVEHGSTENDTKEVGFNIEVVEVTQGDDLRGQEVNVGRQFTSLNTNMALSPLLHTTFGSPHSSRFTDFEDGSDQDRGWRHSNKSGKSDVLSTEGLFKSPIDGGRMASALRATLAAERVTSSSASLSTPVPAADFRLNERSGVHGVVVDVEEEHIPGINIAVDDSFPETEATSPLPTLTSNVTQATVAMDPVQPVPSTDQTEDAERSSFLRPQPPPNQSPHPFARTSMFLPHPNAPKAVYQSQGPMYGRPTAQMYAHPVPPALGAGNTMMHQPTPPGTTFFSTHILHQLRNLSIAASQGPARRPPMTLFARCQPDLSASMGPVPILFSLDPFPPLSMPQMKMGNSKGMPYLENMTPTRAATVSAPVRRGVGDGMLLNQVGPGTEDASMLRLPKRSATAVANADSTQGFNESPSPALPIPREGFVPQVGAARPRSRSFSAFGVHVPVPTPQEKSREEPVMKVRGVAKVFGPPRKTSLPPASMIRYALPPLVLHNSNKDREPDGSPFSPLALVESPILSTQVKVPSSPIAQELVVTYSPTTQVLHMNGPLTSPVTSSPFTNGLDMSPVSGPSGGTNRTSVSSSDLRSATSPHSMPGRQGSFDAPRNGSVEGLPCQSPDSSDSHSLASPPPIPEAVLQSPRYSPLTQEVTLKTKLSLPALRMKASIRSKLDDSISVASFPGSGENETVQVQDMDFELVKPSMPQVTGRASQDSTLTGRDVDSTKPDISPVLGDATSTLSHAPKSPLVPTAPMESIDAHRQRELKWMALFPTIPPSQARKNKKIRKLLQEGVPSSVRYLVWCHLTDSKARALPGVYAKLVKRPPVPAFAEIEKDATEGFPDQPQLHTVHGPLVSLLQAYLSMVPDIQYNSGLTSIAGHLLLLAPEEDAFWIFASMMDAHLRAYFATNTVQIEIDASLFSKALEAIDPALTKKLYVQLSIAPASITRPWFSTLFVGCLSVDYLHRVWDIFLYDGIPYLYRVGLVMINCVRHLLLQANTEEAALAHLIHPPPACLPSATELLVLAANVRLKDDDVRKQRAKMEQQLKKSAQARPPNGVSNVQAATISLPKT